MSQQIVEMIAFFNVYEAHKWALGPFPHFPTQKDVERLSGQPIPDETKSIRQYIEQNREEAADALFSVNARVTSIIEEYGVESVNKMLRKYFPRQTDDLFCALR